MLDTLFLITIIYAIIQILHIWLVGIITGKLYAAEFTIASFLGLFILFGAVIAINIGGKFEFAAGIVYAVMAGCSTMTNLHNIMKRFSVTGGIYCIYNFTMMLLFIVALIP